jgi:hypothetical protein
MSWLKIEDLDCHNRLVSVDDVDAKWICGGGAMVASATATTVSPGQPSFFYGTAYSADVANARLVGNTIYTFGTSADANFVVSNDPTKSGGAVKIDVNFGSAPLASIITW